MSLRAITEAENSHERCEESQEAAKLLLRNEKVLLDEILLRERKNYQYVYILYVFTGMYKCFPVAVFNVYRNYAGSYGKGPYVSILLRVCVVV